MKVNKIKFISKRVALATTAVTLFANLAACAAPSAAPANKAALATAIPEVTIEFNGKEFKVPNDMPGGIVAITMKNTAGKPMDIGIERLHPGKTVDEFAKMIQATPDDFAGLIKVVDTVLNMTPGEPGKSDRVVVDLKTGEFVLDATDHVEGPPVAGAKYIIGSFKAEKLVGTVEPNADVMMELKDFALISPDEVKAGKQVWRVSNTGNQWHMFFIAKPNSGATPEDVAKAASTEGPPLAPFRG